MKIKSLFLCCFFFICLGVNAQELIDKDLYLGDYTNTTGWGKKLVFRGNAFNDATIYMGRYVDNTSSKADLRLNLGVNFAGQDRFIIGNFPYDRPTVWRDLFVVTNQGKVGIAGVSNPQYQLEVNGTIRAKEILVESGWADFVFAPGYELPSLYEVEAHINEYRHLPEIPSEAEVLENGVNLGDINVKLLQKIEELTLYTIQQQKLIDELSNKVNNLENLQK